MAGLVRGWLEEDGGISHAVAPDDPRETLCGMPEPNMSGDPADLWMTAPAPRCQRCEEEA